MPKKYSCVEDNKLLQYILIIVGILLCVIAINGFLAPAKLLGGGITGICIILNKLYNINQGIVSFVLNIPIFIIGMKYLDKKFLWISFINMFLFSFALGITENVYNYIHVNDIMLKSIYGGILNGIGSGLIFKARASAGGVDIIGALMKRKFNIPLKNTFMFINAVVVCAGGFLFGTELVMYTLISMYITVIAMDITKDSFNKNKAILLISDKYDEISKCIMSNMKRGVTFLEAEGAYTNKKKKIIYCIVSAGEVAKFKELAYGKDKHAFISVNDVEEVKGEGFKEKFL